MISSQYTFQVYQKAAKLKLPSKLQFLEGKKCLTESQKYNFTYKHFRCRFKYYLKMIGLKFQLFLNFWHFTAAQHRDQASPLCDTSDRPTYIKPPEKTVSPIVTEEEIQTVQLKKDNLVFDIETVVCVF